MKMNFKSGLLAMMCLSALFTSCDENNVNPEPDPDPIAEHAVKEVEISQKKEDKTVTIDTAFTYFSFTKNSVVELTYEQAKTSKEWDLAFLTGSIRTNGGESGMGECEVYKVNTKDFDGINSVKEFVADKDNWVKDKSLTAYIVRASHQGGRPPQATLSLNPHFVLGGYFTMGQGERGHSFKMTEAVYIVKVAAQEMGRHYVKIQFTGVTGEKSKLFGDIKFRWAYISENGENKYTRVGEKVIDGESNKPLMELISKEDRAKSTILTIKNRALTQMDLDSITKYLPNIKEVNLAKATLNIDETEKGFKDNKTIVKLVMPENLTSTGLGHLAYTNLEEVVFPGDKLTTIGEGTFAFSKKLRKVTLPNSVEIIAKEAFYSAESLTEFTFPSKVRAVPDKCFYGCITLERVTINEGVKRIGEYAFSKCYALTNLVVPASVNTLSTECFAFCENLVSVQIKGAIKEIGESAFFRTNKLTNITFDSATAPEKCHADAFDFLWNKKRKNGEYFMKDFRFVVPKGSKAAYEAKIPGYIQAEHSDRIVEK